MPLQPISWVAVVVVALTTTGILVTRDWRWQMGMMALQYLGAAMLAGAHWPVGLSAAFLVTGWMTIAAIGITFSTVPLREDLEVSSWPEGRAFRLFMAGMVFILAASVAGRGYGLVGGIEAPVLGGSILLSAMGVLQIGTSSQTSRVILGLLTFLTGFEVFYAAVEGSILVSGLLSVVTLGLGLVGAHLLAAAVAEDIA